MTSSGVIGHGTVNSPPARPSLCFFSDFELHFGREYRHSRAPDRRLRPQSGTVNQWSRFFIPPLDLNRVYPVRTSGIMVCMKSHDQRLLRLIAAFKFLKAGLLVALGVGAFKLLHKNIADVAEHWIEALKLDPANRFVDAALGRASNLRPGQIEKLGVGSFIYAGLFLAEGVGLWLLRPWGEWLTVIITSSLLPIEIYEIYQHPSSVRWGVLAINLAIVVYLIYHIRSQQSISN